MSKKAIALSVFFVLLAGIITGCSSEKDAGSGQNSNAGNGDASAQKKSKMIFWDKSEYVKDYNDMQKARVEQFAQENQVDVEYIAIPPGDLKTKLLAAIEAGNPPDLLVADDFVAKQFVGNDQLVEVSDILKKIDFREDAKKYAYALEGWYEVPYYHMPNVMYVRKDKLDEKNLAPPRTWEEVRNVARAINDPKNNFYGVGFQLGGGGDSEGRIGNEIRTWGGNLVNEKAEVTVNSPEALEAIRFDATFFTENLAPQSAITGDDAWNNNAYLAGTVGITLNSSSLMAAMRKDKPELAEKTMVLPFPAGPKAQFSSGAGTVFVMFKQAKNTELAKKFIDYSFEKDYYQQMIEKLNGLAVPAINGLENTEFWQRPENKGWYEATKNILPLGDPGPPDARASRVISENILSKGVQNIVINHMDPQKALDEIEKGYKKVYGQK